MGQSVVAKFVTVWSVFSSEEQFPLDMQVPFGPQVAGIASVGRGNAKRKSAARTTTASR
jgi:hypothetical protein